MQVEGLEGPFYVHESLAELLPLAEQGKLKSTVTSLLSPLTRWYGIGAGRWSCSTLTIGWSVIRRKKNAAMGTSPCRCCTAVSWWGALTPRRTVARVFEIISFHAEPQVRFGKQRAQDIRQAIARTAKWHGAQRVALGDIPAALAAEWGRLGSGITNDAVGG